MGDMDVWEYIPEDWQGPVATMIAVMGGAAAAARALMSPREVAPAPIAPMDEPTQIAPAPAAIAAAVPESLAVSAKINRLLSLVVAHDAAVVRAVIVQVDLLQDGSCVTSVLARQGAWQDEWLDEPTAAAYVDTIVAPLLKNRHCIWRPTEAITDDDIKDVYRATEGMVGSEIYYIAHVEDEEGAPESVMLLSLHCTSTQADSAITRELAVEKLRSIANPE